MTLGEFEARFVDGIGGAVRAGIWSICKDRVINRIAKLQIKCELWLDGSFITKCDAPKDIDGSIMIHDSDVQNCCPITLDFLENFDDAEPPFHPSLDLYLCILYPAGHPLRGSETGDPDGWAEQWSRERNSTWLKGFAVIPFR
jgi:hypothetical protein